MFALISKGKYKHCFKELLLSSKTNELLKCQDFEILAIGSKDVLLINLKESVINKKCIVSPGLLLLSELWP